MENTKIYLDFLPKITPKQLLKTTGYELLEASTGFFYLDGEVYVKINVKGKELYIKRYKTNKSDYRLFFYLDGNYYRYLYYHNDKFYTGKELGNKYLLKSLAHKSRKAITTIAKSLKCE